MALPIAQSATYTGNCHSSHDKFAVERTSCPVRVLSWAACKSIPASSSPVMDCGVLCVKSSDLKLISNKLMIFPTIRYQIQSSLNVYLWWDVVDIPFVDGNKGIGNTVSVCHFRSVIK